MAWKSIELRFHEAAEVRAKLERLGVLVDPALRHTLCIHMNAYIRDAQGAKFKLRVPDVGTLHVTLSCQESVQSGITLEQS